jgi:hypothetical protein
LKTVQRIQGKDYVKVEGWQAIATAHGCIAGSGNVKKVDGGVTAEGYVRRMSDGLVLATAEGFVGEDEPVWYGGKDKYGKVLQKRAEYAIRAMAQTRAISRACRSAFAHVVVLMDAGLSTTPAEEVPAEGFNDHAPAAAAPAPTPVPIDGNCVGLGPWKDKKAADMTLAEIKEMLSTVSCNAATRLGWIEYGKGRKAEEEEKAK